MESRHSTLRSTTKDNTESRQSTLRSTTKEHNTPGATEQETLSRGGSLRPRIRRSSSRDDSRFQNYDCSRRASKLKADSYRKGPIPVEDCKTSKNGGQSVTYGTLDSDCDELDFEDLRIHNATSTGYNKIRLPTNGRGDSLASCRALIVYFSKLARAADEKETIDLSFLQVRSPC